MMGERVAGGGKFFDKSLARLKRILSRKFVKLEGKKFLVIIPNAAKRKVLS